MTTDTAGARTGMGREERRLRGGCGRGGGLAADRTSPARRLHKARGSRFGGARGITFAVLSLGILAAAGFFLWPVLKPDNGGPAGAVTVEVSMSGFSPSRINAEAGVPLTLRFVNNDSQFHTDGGGWHQFAIDDLGLDVKIAPQSTQELTITPPSSGSYEFYCDVCCGGRENPYMVGTLAVGNPV